MLLHTLQIQGFKGIKNLTINFNNDINVLIGETSWGSSSLIAALNVVSTQNILYECDEYDFYHTSECQDDCLQLRFTYVNNPTKLGAMIEDHPDLLAVSSHSVELRQQVVIYEMRASKANGNIETKHCFLDEYDEEIKTERFEETLQELIDFNPLIIFKENYLYQSLSKVNTEQVKELHSLFLDHPLKERIQLTQQELAQGIYAATLLVTYYLASYRQEDDHVRKPTLEDWQVLDKINDLLDQLDGVMARDLLMKSFMTIIFEQMGYSLSKDVLPILLFKNFGGNMHPTITSVGMRLLRNLPVQKILTSHTSDLIPMLSLQNIMRISRFDSEIVVNQVLLKDLNANTNRKVLFHIFHRRPVAMFARCWFLVEGETEIWLLKELAEICGYNLNAEGIVLIEFAQCGISPLIEYAQAMGIEWYAMADGDAAGRHYAKTVRKQFKHKEEYYRHMTQLPARDIENFLFKKGFSSVYKNIAYGSDEFVDKPIHEIIQKAVQKTSKPDLALAVCDFARVRGVKAVPNLLQNTFKKVISLAKGRDI